MWRGSANLNGMGSRNQAIVVASQGTESGQLIHGPRASAEKRGLPLDLLQKLGHVELMVTNLPLAESTVVSARPTLQEDHTDL
jgi:hypothetical protein